MKGTCLCGSITIQIEHEGSFEACHCDMCRKWGGGPFLSIHAKSYQLLSDENKVSKYQSSDWAERGFCQNCGTHLFYYLKPTDDYMVPLGLFQQEELFHFKEQIFIDKK